MAARIISITLVGVDNASKAIAGVGATSQRVAAQSAVAFDASTGKISASFSRLGESAGQSMSRIGSTLTRNVSLPLGIAGGAAIKSSIDFGTAFAKIEGLAGVTGKSLQGLRADVLSLAGETAQSPQKLADAMYFITSAGIEAADATGVLKASAQAASAGLGDVATVAQSVVGAVNAFANQNLTAAQATDVMVATVRNATFEADALAESIGPVTAVASQMGVTFNEVGAALAVMSQGNLDAETSATALKGILTQILKPSDEATKLWAKMFGSMDAVRALLREKGLIAVLQQMSEKVGGNQAAIAKLFPDVRGLVGALSLLGQKQEKVNGIVADFGDVAGDTGKAFGVMSKTLGFELNKALADTQVALISVGDAAGPAISGVAKGISAIATAATEIPAPLVTAGVALAGLAVAAGPGLSIAGAFVRSFSTLGDVVGAVSAKIAAHGVVTAATATASETAAVAQAHVTIATSAQGAAIARAAAASETLKAAIADLALSEEGDVAASLAVVKAKDAETAAFLRLDAASGKLTSTLATQSATKAAGAGAQTGAGAGAALEGAGAGLAVTAGAAAIAVAGLGAAIVIMRSAAAKDKEIKGLAADLLATGEAARRAQAELSRIIAPDIGGDIGKDIQAYADAVASGGDKALIAAAQADIHQAAIRQEAVAFLGAGRAARASADELQFYMDHSPDFAAGVSRIEANVKTATKAIDDLTKKYGAGAIQSAELAAAQKQLRDDLTAIATGADSSGAAQRRLEGDRKRVTAASKIQAGVENDVAVATRKGADAAAGAGAAARGAAAGVNASATAAQSGAFAFLGLADSVKTAADALLAIQSRATVQIRASIAFDQAGTGVQEALDALNNPDTGGGGGGGGGGQTATAAALDQEQKQLGLRDAQRGVEQAAQGVKDAEAQLADAYKANGDATKAVTTAQDHYTHVLHGYSATSREAKEATEALDDAQRHAAESALSVRDAQQSLAAAQQALRDAPTRTAEGAAAAGRSVQSAKLDVTDAELALSDAQQGGDSEEIARAQIALADAQQRVRDATRAAADAQKRHKDVLKGIGPEVDDVKDAQLALRDAQDENQQSTKDLNEAQRIYNGTLHGFAPTSKEAQDAHRELTDAQNTARDSASQLEQAQRGLQSAQDNVATSALQLKRAVADVAGQLDSAGGSAGTTGKKFDSLKTRIDNAKLALLDYADKAAQADQAAGHSLGHSIRAEIDVLQAVVAANPLLAGAFDEALQKLETDFVNAIIATAKTQPSTLHTAGGGGGGSAQHVFRAKGGPIPGNDPSGIPIVAHPKEWVIQAKSVEKYGPHVMAQINAGTFELPKFAVGGPVDNRRISRSDDHRSSVTNLFAAGEGAPGKPGAPGSPGRSGVSPALPGRPGVRGAPGRDGTDAASVQGVHLPARRGVFVAADHQHQASVGRVVSGGERSGRSAFVADRGVGVDRIEGQVPQASHARSLTVNVSQLPHFAAGGPTGSKETLAIVHPREFVLNEKAVEKYGTETIEKLNAGKIPAFASGGSVDNRSYSSSSSVSRPRVSAQSGAPVTVELHVHGDIYGIDNFEAQVVKSLQNVTRKQGVVPEVRTG